jgi:IS5 family transposase
VQRRYYRNNQLPCSNWGRIPKDVLGTTIHTPETFNSNLSTYRKNKLKEGFTQRAAIEPKIGHLKADHRLSRNFYKGIKGDNINVILAAAAMNFKRMMNIWKDELLALFISLTKTFT